MPGAVLLVKSPGVDFLGSVGWADQKHKIPMRTDHAVRVASTTKMFLGITAAMLETEGKLDTSLPITAYLPSSITDRIPNHDRITVRQLLRHTSGIYNYTASMQFQMQAYLFEPKGHWSAERMLRYCYDKPAVFAPGEGYAYSNTNYVLLGLILDAVTGQHHSEAIRQRIIAPLHLLHTYYEFHEPPCAELAHGYERLAGIPVDAYGWTSECAGDGGIISTVSDLAIFVRAVTGQETFLDEATRRLLKSQPVTNEHDKPWYPILHYDFGVSAERAYAGGPWIFGHGGATVGYISFAYHEPENDITLVYFGTSHLVNLVDQGRIDRFENLLKEALYELAVEQTERCSGQ